MGVDQENHLDLEVVTRLTGQQWIFGGDRMSYKVSVVIEKDEHGYYAYSPELDGCQSQGDTMEEVIGNIREAVELYLDTLTRAEKKSLLSKEIFSTSLEVKVA